MRRIWISGKMEVGEQEGRSDEGGMNGHCLGNGEP